MGTPRAPVPAKLVVAMLSAHPTLFDQAEEALTAVYGPVDRRSALMSFTHTTYYAAEFGRRLLRRLISFTKLIDPGMLAGIKRHTNDLEDLWAHEEQRRVNLDPGYLTAAKLVLASTKDHAHRVYIGRGIYAEVTLAFRKGGFEPWPWTYSDYQSADYHTVLLEMRRTYMRQLAELRGATPTRR
jgi:hypothetical protein